ncbi:MAG: HNH endonuclease signature motif containing protein [Xenococcaceae cyanobacterium]
MNKKGNKSRSVLVHRLMALTFLGSPPTPFHQVRHLNGDPTCNKIENLAWGTAKENAADRVRHGRTSGKPSRFGIQDREEMLGRSRAGVTVKNIATEFKLSTSYCYRLIREDRPNIGDG